MDRIELIPDNNLFIIKQHSNVVLNSLSRSVALLLVSERTPIKENEGIE